MIESGVLSGLRSESGGRAFPAIFAAHSLWSSLVACLCSEACEALAWSGLEYFVKNTTDAKPTKISANAIPKRLRTIVSMMGGKKKNMRNISVRHCSAYFNCQR